MSTTRSAENITSSTTATDMIGGLPQVAVIMIIVSAVVVVLTVCVFFVGYFVSKK